MKIILTCILGLFTGILLGQDSAYVCHYMDLSTSALEKLNTKSIEFSPMYYRTGLVYVVAREKNRFIDPKTGRAYFDLMYSDLGPEGQTSDPVSFSPNIRTQYHEGPCAFNSDHTELFFTRSNLSGGEGIQSEEGQVQLKIYKAVKGQEDWEGIMELPFCSNDYSVAHPALSPDGKYLVFASDMTGGQGGMDLYITNRLGESWSVPVNLGIVINTKGHEVFPYWHPAGYLFFSSDGHEGLGGLDMFVTAWNNIDTFAGIQHLESPFSSSKDDLGMIVSRDGTSGYFASDRKPTKGKDDLYHFSSPRSIFCNPLLYPEDMLQHKSIMVMGENNLPVEKANFWIIPMNQQGPSLHKEHFQAEMVPKNDPEGTVYLRWVVTDTLSTETANAISDRQGKVVVAANQTATYILVAQHSIYESYAQVFAGNQLPESIWLKRIPDESVPCLKTLFTVYDDKGELKLNGAKIQLTGSCLKKPLTFYTDESGSLTQCLAKGCVLKAEIEQEGYAPHAFTFTPTEGDEHWKVYLKSSDHLISSPAPIASGTVIVLDNIYYDFNKSTIRKGEDGELIALAKILKQYPDLTIELTSHTDTRGSAEYNMELSEKRSNSSKAFLVLQGVKAARIITKAAGESSPRNKCLDDVPCTETEHQYNRRTEVRITNPAQGMEIKYKSEG